MCEVKFLLVPIASLSSDVNFTEFNKGGTSMFAALKGERDSVSLH